MKVVYYVSGHGYGHATRTIAVLEALVRTQTNVSLQVRTAVPPWLFHASLGHAVEIVRTEVDSGVVERDLYHQDIKATVDRCLSVCSRASQIVEEEAQAVRRMECDVIVGDIPYLVGPIGRRAGVPTIAVGNFSWDYIYEVYALDERLRSAVQDIRRWYGMVDLMLRLPLGHEMTAFSNVRDIPLLCRRATLSREQVRELLGLADSAAPLVFIALRHPTSLTRTVAELVERGYDVVTVNVCEVPTKGRVVLLGREWESRFVDVLGASDVAISKLGYSIAAECIGTGVPLVFPPRFDYVEHDVLKKGIARVLPHVEMTLEDCVDGRWWPYVERLLKQPPTMSSVDLSGDAAVAAAILHMGTGRAVNRALQ